MSKNGQLTLDFNMSPLGQPSSHFNFSPTGELADAVAMPPDEDFIGAVVIEFALSRSDSKAGLVAENTFIPPEDELMLPTKAALLDGHDRFCRPAQEFPAKDPRFWLACEARWNACQNLQRLNRHILGGLVDYKDVGVGVFFDKNLPEYIRRTARLMTRAVDWSDGSKRAQKAMLRAVTESRDGSVSDETISTALGLIIGCSIERSPTFRQKLGFREQESIPEQPVSSERRLAQAA